MQIKSVFRLHGHREAKVKQMTLNSSEMSEQQQCLYMSVDDNFSMSSYTVIYQEQQQQQQKTFGQIRTEQD